MNKRHCHAVITALEYAIQFAPEPDSVEVRHKLFKIVWYGRIFPFSIAETRRALLFLEQRPQWDISKFLPQPHSNELLRRVFSELNRTLSKLP
jgi:hypothetical protein